MRLGEPGRSMDEAGVKMDNAVGGWKRLSGNGTGRVLVKLGEDGWE